MAIISLPNTYQTGQVIDAGKEMANLNVIVNDYNGNITNANLSSSIAITDSKLNQITTASKVSGTALTGLASIPSGAGVIPAANLTYANVPFPYIKVSERQAQNTGGGNSVSGSWITRVLNTTDTDTTSISSLGSNQVTLPAGTYLVRASAPFVITGVVQLRLQNITASTTLLTGQNMVLNTANGGMAIDHLVGQIVLASSSALAVQYQCGSSQSGGLGSACNFGTEVYTVAEFIKTA